MFFSYNGAICAGFPTPHLQISSFSFGRCKTDALWTFHRMKDSRYERSFYEKNKIVPFLLFFLLFLFLAVFSVHTISPAGISFSMVKAKENPSHEQEIKNSVNEFQKKTHCNSVSIAVLADGTISYYGNASTNDLYQIGSMTKAFTGMGIMKLIHEGALHPEDDLTDYLKDFSATYQGKSTQLQIRDLLTHKSGLSNTEPEKTDSYPALSLSEKTAFFSGQELRSAPGTEFFYSNDNYNLLGLVIEAVSGRSYKDYMEQEILRPLGMNHTFVGFPPDNESPKSGTRTAFWIPVNYNRPVRDAAIPAGYFYSDIVDMGRWIQIWTGSADIPDEYREIISGTKELFGADETYYAGWEYFTGDVLGHSGGTPSFSSRMVFSRTGKTGVCVLTNLNVAASTDWLCNNIYAIATGKETSSFVSDVWSIFDTISSLLTLAGVLCFFLFLCLVKNKKIILITGIFLAVLLISMLFVLPAIFQSDIITILTVWAPWSLLCTVGMLFANVILFTVKFISVTHRRP